jgi:hypothetical protein
MIMILQTLEPSPDALLERIDLIMRELQALRQTVQAMTKPTPSAPLAQELFGSLGQGTPEEYEPDIDINWQRFDDGTTDF